MQLQTINVTMNCVSLRFKSEVLSLKLLLLLLREYNKINWNMHFNTLAHPPTLLE